MQELTQNKQTPLSSQESRTNTSSNLTSGTRNPTIRIVKNPLKAQVQLGYSRSWVVNKYAVVGLWPSEDELLTTYMPPGCRLLDLGCGAGRTTLPLARQNYFVTGVDLSFPMVRKGRDQARYWRLPTTWSVLDATDLPFRNQTFDGALFSYNGIELVPGIEGKRQVLQEVWRVLEPGGHLIFTTHAIEAFNRYALGRMRRLATFLIGRLLRRNISEREIGEIVHTPDRNLEVYYMQIISPRVYRKLLTDIGFELVYYNSRRRIDAQKPPGGRLIDFDPDFDFYVAKKPN